METLIKFEQKQSQEHRSRQLDYLYKRWASILIKYANYYLNDSEAASSVVNDIFIKLWKGEQEVENTKGYLFKSVKNASLNHLSSTSKKQVSYVEVHELVLISDESQIQEFYAEESAQLVHLQKLISKLPEKRQLVFKMHRIEGFSYIEIADLLGISIRTVEDHLVKSMKYIHENCRLFFNR